MQYFHSCNSLVSSSVHSVKHWTLSLYSHNIHTYIVTLPTYNWFLKIYFYWNIFRLLWYKCILSSYDIYMIYTIYIYTYIYTYRQKSKLRVNKYLKGKLHTSEVLVTASTLLVVKRQKHLSEHNRNIFNNESRAHPLNNFQKLFCF